MSRIGQGIKKSILTANSVLYAVTASVPAALSMAASRILGRKSSGNVVALTATELRTLISVENGATADLTGSEIVALLEALGSGSQLSHDELDDVSPADHHTKYSDANARSAAVSDAIYGAGWNGVTTIAPSKNAVYDKIETLGGATIASGSYVGNESDNRQITTGFKCSLVILARGVDVYRWVIFNSSFVVRDSATAHNATTNDALLHATDGFIVDTLFANVDFHTYYYWAISE